MEYATTINVNGEDIKVERLRDGAHTLAGSFDKASRWYPDEEYVVPGSFEVRSPSRRWPFSYLKHFYTLKYAQMLAYHRPDLYMYLQGIDNKSVDRMDNTDTSITAKVAAELLKIAEELLEDEIPTDDDVVTKSDIPEEHVDAIEGGYGANLDIEDVDETQLVMGIQHELEHTVDSNLSEDERIEIATDIALDHLAEDPEYYTNLQVYEESRIEKVE